MDEVTISLAVQTDSPGTTRATKLRREMCLPCERTAAPTSTPGLTFCPRLYLKLATTVRFRAAGQIHRVAKDCCTTDDGNDEDSDDCFHSCSPNPMLDCKVKFVDQVNPVKRALNEGISSCIETVPASVLRFER